MPQEIEVKYIVRTVPGNLNQYRNEKIRQGYIVAEEGANVVRIRQKGEGYFLTVKGVGHLSREETEIRLSFEQFEALWPLTDGKRLEKIRYYIDQEDFLIELDIFEGFLDGLKVAEVEFESEEEAETFVPPTWFDREVTWDSRYKNSKLALFGKPQK